MFRSIAIFTAAAVLLTASVARAQTADALLTARIDALAAKELAKPTAGLSIAVSRHGKVIFAKGYGLANVEHSAAVTPSTVFHICSISKNILAAAVMRLVDQGKLSLDDEVTKYVPDAPVHGRRITIRQLLDHTSGLYSFTSLPDADTNERLDLTHEQVLALIKDRPPLFEPGTAWQYDNTAFYLAGMVVERVTGREYGQYVKDDIFAPLGMNSTSLCYARDIVPHLSAGYGRDHDKLVNADFLTWRLPSAAGAVCSTAPDLLRWHAALDVGKVVRPASLAIMRSPTGLTDGTAIDYGLGTRLGSLDGHRINGHTGSGGGFGNALVSFPDDGLTVVVLTNTGNSTTSALLLAAAIARSILALKEPKLVDLDVPTDELAALTGTFTGDDGTVENFAKDGKLHYRNPANGNEGVLMCQGPNIYAVAPNVEIHFTVRNGHASSAQVYIAGMLMDSARRQ